MVPLLAINTTDLALTDENSLSMEYLLARIRPATLTGLRPHSLHWVKNSWPFLDVFGIFYNAPLKLVC